MNVAEELQCDWSRVRVESGSILRNQIENGVYSSGFLPFFGGHGTDKVRMKFALQLGASARERLKAAAAARWGVPVSEVLANDSVLIPKASDRQLRYGDVVTDAAKLTQDAEPPLTTTGRWTARKNAGTGKQ